MFRELVAQHIGVWLGCSVALFNLEETVDSHDLPRSACGKMQTMYVPGSGVQWTPRADAAEQQRQDGQSDQQGQRNEQPE